MFSKYDIVVVGAGHAGCEAAAAAANLNAKVLLITMNMANMAQMSCNPAMGGIAKGQIIREIDALGGYAGIITDKTMIQFRMLNRSKGPAMWSPRAQNDRMLFSYHWRMALENTKNLDFWEDQVVGLIIKDNKITGVTTRLGVTFKAKAVILTNGTFLNGVIHIGAEKFKGGRIGEQDSTGITEKLVKLGFESDRMKTGTPVRVDGRTIDYSKLIEQKGDNNPGKFSFTNTPPLKKQRSCYLAYTSPEVHDILRTGFKFSPLFEGRIKGIGPRYCPSIEDKIERFSDKESHQLFIEPEGWDTVEVYVNGFSSSLPKEIQYKALKKIEGFEHAKIFRPGYAIEYDFFPPQQLSVTLETKIIENLFFAGQINGTTGYEEAGAQGIIAGINACRKINKQKSFVLGRDQAYIGVLIDDLITKGVDEPYRMFTSRAEYRILLRHNNADIRLTPLGYEIGLASKERLENVQQKNSIIEKIIDILKTHSADPLVFNPLLKIENQAPMKQKVKANTILLRPNITLDMVVDKIGDLKKLKEASPSSLWEACVEEAEIQMKYYAYIRKEKEIATKFNKYEDIILDPATDYHQFKALSYESRDKLNKMKPTSIKEAAAISGVSPADIAVLLVVLNKR